MHCLKKMLFESISSDSYQGGQALGIGRRAVYIELNLLINLI